MESFNPVSKEQSGHQNYAAWVLGESFDIDQLLEAHLISLLIMDNSSSPLYGALESNDISKSPAQILGLEDSSIDYSVSRGIIFDYGLYPVGALVLAFGILKRITKDVEEEALEALLED